MMTGSSIFARNILMMLSLVVSYKLQLILLYVILICLHSINIELLFCMGVAHNSVTVDLNIAFSADTKQTVIYTTVLSLQTI